MLSLVLSLLLTAHQGDSLRLSFALYSFGAASDELTSRGKREVGMVPSIEGRIALKAALLPVYLLVTHEASKSERGYVRRIGGIGRWGVPAMFIAGALHNFRAGH